MATLEFLVLLAFGAFLAGLAGSFLGLGGGVFLIPLLTIVLSVDIHTAIGASLVGVIATSSGGASVYVRDRLTNLKLGMFLEIATTTGALLGASVAILLEPEPLILTFGVVSFCVAGYMVWKRDTARDRAYRGQPARETAGRLDFGNVYFDGEDGAVYRYRVERVGPGFGVGLVAGAVSGMLGVGSGFITVPAMNGIMKVPMKVAVATSNFIIGVTAAASAWIYYSRGFVDPLITGIVIAAVFSGTVLGTRFLERTKGARVRRAFSVALVVVGISMILHGLGVFPR